MQTNQPNDNVPLSPSQSAQPIPQGTVPAGPNYNQAYAPAPAPQQGTTSRLLIALIFILLLGAAGIFFYGFGQNRAGLSSDTELNNLRAARNSLTLSAGGGKSALTAEGLVNRISTDAEDLSTLLDRYASSLTAKDALLAQKTTELDTLNRLNGSLSNQIVELEKKLQDSQLNSALKAQLEADLADTKRLLASSTAEVTRLNALLADMPDTTDLASALGEVERLRSKLNSAPSQAQIMKLEEDNRALRNEIADLRTKTNRSRLFAENADLLSANGQRLFKRLTTLEGVSNSERLSVYNTIRSELNARVIDTVNFASGSSAVDQEKIAAIETSLITTSPNAEYLIVGYASKSGDAALNRELSAKRATSVATIADIQRGSTQTVKAVFLGQTDRFSRQDGAANQVCEIWEIIPE